ncbi:MAG TPA: ATP phosphoribosyltransferase regulatory subunit [Solirubrobacteraceae bacterium]|nr:ATP phosphoribosyltransferase regulatory subunit [Solirubrobacteraceae bacterium]
MTIIHPLPSGTRDVLPDEMRELRSVTTALLGTFEREGYGEVSTPALEHQEVLQRGGGAQPAYRVMDEHGQVLALRPDMTVPIARLAATRYADVEPPLRFCYLADVYRGVRPHRGQMREFLQAGVELIGAPSPQGTAEALRVLCAALDAAGLRDYRVGLGDAALYPALLETNGVPPEARAVLLGALVARDFVGLERELRALDLTSEARAALTTAPSARGGLEVLRTMPAAEGLRRVHELLDPDVADRVLLDLGLTLDLGYYTGAVFEVYDPALGEPLGGGGRYDELLGRFGRPLPAVGFALGVDKLHIALTGEEERT